jgi:hypothetical protein
VSGFGGGVLRIVKKGDVFHEAYMDVFTAVRKTPPPNPDTVGVAGIHGLDGLTDEYRFAEAELLQELPPDVLR